MALGAGILRSRFRDGGNPCLIKPNPSQKKKTYTFVYRRKFDLGAFALSRAARRELLGICSKPDFVADLQYPLEKMAASRLRTAKPPTASGKEITRFLNQLECTANSLLKSLKTQDSGDPGFVPTFAEELMNPHRPLIHELRKNLKTFLEVALPEARRHQAQTAPFFRQDLDSLELVVIVERVFKNHGLAIRGRNSRLRRCLETIFSEAGIPKNGDAVSQIISRRRTRMA